MKVLVVEHESLMALDFVDEITRAGHTVIGPVADYEAALTLATLESPDVAIVDLDADLQERIRLVCTLDGLFGIRSLVLSVNPYDAGRCKGPAISILHKPVNPEDIVGSLNRATGTTSSGSWLASIPLGGTIPGMRASSD